MLTNDIVLSLVDPIKVKPMGDGNGTATIEYEGKRYKVVLSLKEYKEYLDVLKRYTFLGRLGTAWWYRHLAALPDAHILSKDISDRITSPYKQNGKIVITGRIGSGKSYAGISLAEDVARWNSLALDGDLDHAYKYFKPDSEHIATIDPESITTMLEGADKRYNIYIVDDAAAAWSNRKWQSQQNEILNSWFGIMRTYQTAIILTVQSDKFIDAMARALFDYYVEMTGPHAFHMGWNFGKVFITALHPRDTRHPLHTLYPTKGRIQFIKHGFCEPTSETIRFYDELRERMLNKHAKKSFAKIRNGGEKILGKRPSMKSMVRVYLEKHKDANIEDIVRETRVNYTTAEGYYYKYKKGKL